MLSMPSEVDGVGMEYGLGHEGERPTVEVGQL
jgi:hypothetical protein